MSAPVCKDQIAINVSAASPYLGNIDLRPCRMPLHTRCRLKACAVLCISTELGLVLICDFISAGDACRVWRYFESVPEEMSSMRTQEAAAVADRHLRLLIYHSSVSLVISYILTLPSSSVSLCPQVKLGQLRKPVSGQLRAAEKACQPLKLSSLHLS